MALYSMRTLEAGNAGIHARLAGERLWSPLTLLTLKQAIKSSKWSLEVVWMLHRMEMM